MAGKWGFSSEWKLLPWMLGKLLGGMTAVGGFTAAVVILTRHAAPNPGSVFAALLAGGAGIGLFLASSRSLARQTPPPAAPRQRRRTSALAWLLLLLCAGLFLLSSWILTR